MPFVWISTQAVGVGRLTERGRPLAGKERVDTVRKNESVLLCSSFKCTCTCRFEEIGASVTA